MQVRYIFHISIPVSDLAAAGRFYTDVLGGKIGRTADDWLDILLWGHQITLQLRPGEVASLELQGKRHFGAILPWHEWEELAARLDVAGVTFVEPPVVLFMDTPEEQGKFYLADPSNNVIEVKTYRDPTATVGCGDIAYGNAV